MFLEQHFTRNTFVVDNISFRGWFFSLVFFSDKKDKMEQNQCVCVTGQFIYYPLCRPRGSKKKVASLASWRLVHALSRCSAKNE